MFALPLQVVDNFLLQYNLGQALIVLLVVSLPPVFLQRSGKLLALLAITFGLLFALVPSIDGPSHYLFVGVALMMAAPLLYVSSGR